MADYTIVEEALKRGYTMDEIADNLARDSGIDPADARGRGYTTGEMMKNLGYSTPEPGFISGLIGQVAHGAKVAAQSVASAPGIYGGNPDAERIAETIRLEQNNKKPKEMQEAEAAFGDVTKRQNDYESLYGKDTGFMDSVGKVLDSLVTVGKQIVGNPKGAAYEMASQAGNMAAPMIGAYAGGKVGAVGGTLVAPGAGTAAGAAGGAAIGAFAGSHVMEQTGEFRGKVADRLAQLGLDPSVENVSAILQDKEWLDRTLTETRNKATGTAAVDAVLAAVGGKALAAPMQAAARTARAELGATATAEKIAERASEILAKQSAWQHVAPHLKAGAIGWGGEPVSEAAGQQVGYGHIDYGDVGMEALAGIGEGVGTVYSAGTAMRQAVAHSNPITKDPQQSPILNAESADQAVAEFSAQTAPRGTFGSMDEFAGLLASESADVRRRRSEVAGQQQEFADFLKQEQADAAYLQTDAIRGAQKARETDRIATDALSQDADTQTAISRVNDVGEAPTALQIAMQQAQEKKAALERRKAEIERVKAQRDNQPTGEVNGAEPQQAAAEVVAPSVSAGSDVVPRSGPDEQGIPAGRFGRMDTVAAPVAQSGGQAGAVRVAGAESVAPTFKPLPEQSAKNLAKSFTNQGSPTVAIPHPSIPGMWAVASPEEARKLPAAAEAKAVPGPVANAAPAVAAPTETGGTVEQTKEGTLHAKGYTADQINASAQKVGAKVIFRKDGTAIFAKGTNADAVKEALGVPAEAPQEVRQAVARKQPSSDNLLQAIINRGGISTSLKQDILGDASVKTRPGLFTSNGTSDLGALASRLSGEFGFSQIDLNDATDNSGSKQLADLVHRAVGGESVLNEEAMIRAQEAEAQSRHQEEIHQKADELGIKRAGRGRPFSKVEAEVLKAIEVRLNKEIEEAGEEVAAARDMARQYLDDDKISEIEDKIADSLGENPSILETYRALAAGIKEAINENVRNQQASNAEASRSDGEDSGAGSSEEASRPAFDLAGQTEAEARAAQERLNQPEGLTKEQIDREATAPFSLHSDVMAPTEGPAGETTAMFTPDGRTTVAADRGLSNNSEESVDKESQKIDKDPIAAVKATLDAAGVTGTDRTSTIAAVRRGDLTPEDVAEAHPVDAHAFVKAPDGSIDFGEITEDQAKAMRRQPGKIRLERGVQNSDGTGQGLAYIEANHGKQIRGAGFETVESFVGHVATKFNEILQASGRQLLVAVDGGRQDVMFVQLEPAADGDYYRINSAFPASRNYLEKQQKKGMKLLWGGSEPASPVAGQQTLYAGIPEIDSGQGAPIAQGQSSDATIADEDANGNIQNKTAATAEEVTKRADGIEPDQPSFDVEPITRKQELQAKGQDARIQDFGEKIGGARKDIAKQIGKRGTMPNIEDDRPAWARKYIAMQDVKTGKWTLNTKVPGSDGATKRTSSAKFDTEAEALNAIPLAEVSRNHRVYSYEKDGSREWGIYRNITDRKRALVKGGFATYEDAMKDMAANPVPIIEHKFDFPERPWLDRIERIGANVRTGDVTTKMFQDTFGFRGGEFGNWNMGGDGQEALNHAYDALHDLANAIGVPPKALSLNGQLAIAFGARGKGGKNSAAAHYEPGAVVINLTKIKGAGSAAHEWWHALDDYFANEASDSVVASGFGSKSEARPELVDAFKNLVDTIMHAEHSTTTDADVIRNGAQKRIDSAMSDLDYRLNDLRQPYSPKRAFTEDELKQWDAIVEKLRNGDLGDQVYIANPSKMKGAIGYSVGSNIRDLNAIYKQATGRSFMRADPSSVGRQMQWMVDAIAKNKEKLATKEAVTTTSKGRSEFYLEARKIDGYRASDYWSIPEEMGARAFESYIFDKLTENEKRSDYLVHGVENRFYSALDMKPYPEGEERQRIDAAFDRLFDTIKTRETDKGIALESRSNLSREAFAHNALQELATEDALFRYPVSKSASVDGVMRDVFPGVEYYGEHTLPDERTETGADNRYVFRTPDTPAKDGRPEQKGKQFEVFTTDAGRVWVDVHRLQPGDQGSRVYAAVANYAHNSRKVFGGDPVGVSPDAIVARTKMMLASALRFGTTRHLDAAYEQEKGIPDSGIPPLDWRGNDIDKTRALIHTFLETVHNNAPDIKDFYYDFEKGQFVDARTGERVHPASFASNDAIRESQRGAARIGQDSGRAAVLIQSLVSEEGGRVGDGGILQAILDNSRALIEDGGLKGLFSKTTPANAGVSVSGGAVQQIRGVVDRFRETFKGADGLDIRVVSTFADIPERYRQSPFAEGVYHSDSGLIYLVAMNLRDSMTQEVDAGRAYQVLLHEAVGHHGLAQMMGDRFGAILKHVKSATSTNGRVTEDSRDTFKPGDKDYTTWEAVQLRYPDATDSEVAQEVLARMSETDPGSSVLGYAVATVRQWVRDVARAVGFNVVVSTSELRDLVAKASGYMRRGDNLAEERIPSGLVAASQKGAPTPDSRELGSKALDETRMQERQAVRAEKSGSRAEPTQFDGGARSDSYAKEIPSKVQESSLKAARYEQDYINRADLQREIDSIGMNGMLDLSKIAKDPRYFDEKNEEFTEDGFKEIDRLTEEKARDNLRLPKLEEISDLNSAHPWAQHAAMLKILDGLGIDHDDLGGSPTSRYIMVSGVKVRFSDHENMARNVASREGESLKKIINVAPNQESFTDALKEILATRKSADMLESRARIIGDSGRQYTPEQQQMFKTVGREANDLNTVERIKKWANKNWVQGIVDQFAPIKDIDLHAYTLTRLSKGAAGAFEAFMDHGKLSLKDGVYDADTGGGVMQNVFFPLGKETTDFLYWIAGNRAERLAKEGKERLFSPADIAASKALADGVTDFDYTLANGKTTRDRTLIYADSLKKFNEYNKNVMDMAEQSGLIDGASRHLWEHEFYVPFYRVMDESDGGVRGMNIKQGVVRQQAFKKLKGGEEGLNDLLANTLMNWAHLIDASAKNRAAKATLEAAQNLGIAQPAGYGEKKTVWYMDGGQKREYLVDDPQLLIALQGLDYAGLRGPIMDILGKTKHILTLGVTASPFFKIRNLIRDSVQAVGTSDLSYNIAKNLKQGAELTNHERQEYVSALAGGALIRFGTMLEGNEAARTRQLIKKGAKDEHILDNESKVRAFYDKYLEPGIAAYNEIGNRGEEINRMALYDQLIKHGKSHAEASLMARDLMDFSLQGSFTTIRFLTQTVPFMNARLQGLYKLGRSAKDEPAKMAIVTGMVALASLALLAAYGDDDDWKKREDWDRNNYWWFKFGGVAFRIPKPFELGAIGTLAERSAELIFDNEMTGKRFKDVVLAVASDQLAMNPVPQLVKPLIDIYANKDSFTGRPIESMSMEKLAPQYRYNAGTSMVARGASTAIGGALSPVQIDHLVRGYFSWLGAFAVGTADMAVRAASDEPTRPTMDYWKTATGGMVSEIDSSSSRYVSQMYEQAKELEQAYGTWRQLRKEGKIEDAAEYRADHAAELRKYHAIEGIKKAESKLNERIRMIERSNKEPAEKRDLIQQIQKQKDLIARRAF